MCVKKVVRVIYGRREIRVAKYYYSTTRTYGVAICIRTECVILILHYRVVVLDFPFFARAYACAYRQTPRTKHPQQPRLRALENLV